MKPIIINMEEMSDSTEVYGSRPSPVLSGVIYCLCALLVVAGIWAKIFQIDVVVRSSGMVKSNDTTATIITPSSGTITEYMMEDGYYVEAGQALFQIGTTEAELQKENTENSLEDIEEKIVILNAYLKVLDGEKEALGEYKDNSYYAQYQNRLALIENNCTSIGVETEELKSQYATNIENLEKAMETNVTEEEQLNQMLECVKSRNNTFSETDLYYFSMVDSYISTYSQTAVQYDSQIRQLKEMITEENDYSEKITALQQEKETALGNLEKEMVIKIEQSLLSIQSNRTELEASIAQAEIELNNLSNGQADLSKEQIIENEKAVVYSELSTYLSQKTEHEKTIESLNYAIEQATVVAQCSGYLNLYVENTKGDYILAGTEIGTIVPEGDGTYKVQIYLDNQDIGKIKEGHSVKYEIGAYPSSEYGQAEGVITCISEDLKINQNTGTGYYLAEANITLPDSVKEMELKQGMAVEAKVIVGEKSAFQFLLEKLDLLFDIE